MRLTAALRLMVLLALASGLVLIQWSAPAEAGRRRLTDSQHLEPIPPPGPCDVVITPKNQDTTIPMLNDPSKRVFCVDPGNYRRQLHPQLRVSGTANARRYLRYNAPFPAPAAVKQTKRAVFHGLMLNEASYWVIEGITVQPVDPQNLAYLVAILSGSHNILERNLLDASRQPNYTQQRGVLISANRGAGGSTYNTIQRNVIRGGNLNRVPIDYTGVSINAEDERGAAHDFNKVLDNEIYDWGDGVQVSAMSSDCSASGSWAAGTVIDGNDIYIRKSKYVDCATGAPDRKGDCSCSENGIDIKSPAAASKQKWTRITNNRLWGFRPTLRNVASCGGSGARGSAINAGNHCAAHVLVANNVISDSTAGIVSEGSDWSILGNLVSETRAAGGNRGIAIFPFSEETRVQFNTIVAVDNSYGDTASGIRTLCNAVIHDEGTRGEGAARGQDHIVKFNDLYASVSPDLESPTTQSYPTSFDSMNATLCVERQRFTNPNFQCIPFAHTTQASPHLKNAPAACSGDPGASFGMSGLSFP